jgi:ureidoacrylate peracid hydrolase
MMTRDRNAPEGLATLAERLHPLHACLLVVDLQNDFCADGGYVNRLGRDVRACQAVIGPIGSMVEAARTAGVPVIWLHAEYDADVVPEPMRLRQAKIGSGAPCCARGSWGAEPYGLAPAPHETVVRKHTFSGFTGTSLDALLRSRGVRTLVVVGVQTNVCVESTLREGHSLGYYVVVPRDCVASHMPDEHAATLANTAFLFGDVVDSEGVTACWQAFEEPVPGRGPDPLPMPA